MRGAAPFPLIHGPHRASQRGIPLKTLDIILLAENRALLPDGHAVTSNAPILAACRKALRRGLADAGTMFRARWRGAAHDAMTGNVGEAAALTIAERDRDVIRFRPYRPHGEQPTWRKGRARKPRPLGVTAHGSVAPEAAAA